MLAVAAYMIWAAAMPHAWLRAVPIAASLFAVGRILFAIGYERGAPGRAMGFGLTAYPTFAMLRIGCALYCEYVPSQLAEPVKKSASLFNDYHGMTADFHGVFPYLVSPVDC